MHAIRSGSAARLSSMSSRRGKTVCRSKFRGMSPRTIGTSAAVDGVAATQGASSSRSTAVLLSALATLGASSASTASAFSPSTFGSGSIAMSGARLLATSAASTLAVTLLMPQQTVMCWGRRHDDDDADRKRNGKRENDDAENTKKLVQDLVAAVNGFGSDVTKAVDGAVKRKNGRDEREPLGDVVRKRLNKLMESGAPTQISFGFGMGVCCGFAAKKTAKVALVGAGLAFGSLQLLSYMGYIELDYTKIEDEVMNSLDLDKNGKVDTDDLQELWNRAMKVLSYNLPTGSGFVAGALLGARMG
ncbi:unnamed protein product [Ectocarpus sp. 12 AP-2014]